MYCFLHRLACDESISFWVDQIGGSWKEPCLRCTEDTYSKPLDLQLAKTISLLSNVHTMRLLVCRAFYMKFKISTYFLLNACLRSGDVVAVIELHTLMFLLPHKFVWLSLLAVIEVHAVMFLPYQEFAWLPFSSVYVRKLKRTDVKWLPVSWRSCSLQCKSVRWLKIYKTWPWLPSVSDVGKYLQTGERCQRCN